MLWYFFPRIHGEGTRKFMGTKDRFCLSLSHFSTRNSMHKGYLSAVPVYEITLMHEYCLSCSLLYSVRWAVSEIPVILFRKVIYPLAISALHFTIKCYLHKIYSYNSSRTQEITNTNFFTILCHFELISCAPVLPLCFPMSTEMRLSFSWNNRSTRDQIRCCESTDDANYRNCSCHMAAISIILLRSDINPMRSQNYWGFGLCPSSHILRTREHKRFANWICFRLQVVGKTYSVGY
jgi:hypothetical protein